MLPLCREEKIGIPSLVINKPVDEESIGKSKTPREISLARMEKPERGSGSEIKKRIGRIVKREPCILSL